MTQLLPEYKNSLIQDLLSEISSNSSSYYVFASNPEAYPGTAPNTNPSDYSASFENTWLMLFGKKISNNDIVPVIYNNIWQSDTTYDRYDNTSNTLYVDSNYYVIAEPETVGGYYHIYKCIDNANNALSTVKPSTILTPTQPTSFETADGYIWRYITSISSSNYEKFSTEEYAPLYVNSSIVSLAGNNSGVEVINVTNGGVNYNRYANGTVSAVVNTTVIQVTNSEPSSFYYDGNAIYLYNTSSATSQLLKISQYISNSSGNWVYFTEPANTSIISPAITQYNIVPDIIVETDGVIKTKAYCTINTSSNSINKVIVLEKGSFVTWANVSVESPSGSNADLYAIINSPGGHGSSPANELNVQGMALSIGFVESESNTIISSTQYNKIGIVKNVHNMESDLSKGLRFSGNTFSQVLKANVTPSYTFSVGERVRGVNSGAYGIVAFSNSTQVFIAGDKNFQNTEELANSSGSAVTSIIINEIGDVYQKDIVPIYTQNINNIERSGAQTETYKLIIKV